MSDETIDKILNDAFDIHLHSKPSVFPRLMNTIELAKYAKKKGLAGFFVKNHHFPTMGQAYHVTRMLQDFKVYGGVVLNYSVGGLSPITVKTATSIGAKIVWMPTIDALNHKKFFGVLGLFKKDKKLSRLYEGRNGITIHDEKGGLLPNVSEILDYASDSNLIIATGHLSVQESKTLVHEAAKRGLKILVTHVNFRATSHSLEDQLLLAKKGALLEVCYNSLLQPNSMDHKTMSSIIKQVGYKNYIISSDLGQPQNPPPPQGLHEFIKILLDNGLDEDMITVMVKDNPIKLIQG